MTLPPGCDGIPYVSGQLHRQPAVHRHSEHAGLLVDNLPQLPASRDRLESLTDILSEDWNYGRSCSTILLTFVQSFSIQAKKIIISVKTENLGLEEARLPTSEQSQLGESIPLPSVR